MKHVFIINPKSGKDDKKEGLLNQLKKYKDKLDYQIYITKSSKDATRYVDEYCKQYKEDVTFYACGGDGTLNEVVSGAIGHNNAIVSIYPCGSGNDFVKIYGGKEKFSNIEHLINGVETKIDVMRINDNYSVNVTNIGFEASVCDIANRVRRKKIIGGKRSYTSGIVASLFTARKNKCTVIADDEILIDKSILLATFANGKYVGGKYKCAPRSNNEDGLLEICIVKPISLLRFISLIGKYEKGTHLDNPKLKKFITYKQSKKIIIDTPKESKICLDGEIYTGTHFEIENMKQVLRFIKPKE